MELFAVSSFLIGMDRYCLASSELTAVINAQGAELCSLRDKDKNELLWQAGPAWPRHAPNLFPIVGSLHNDTFRHQGQDYKMARHGFARDREFSWGMRMPSSCNLFLTDDAKTWQNYPFPFRLDVRYAIAGNGLSITYTVTNTGDSILPASIGAHPAFRWPLSDGAAKNTHRLTFSRPEEGRIRQLRDGLLSPETMTGPLSGQVLDLHEGLFANDAIIFDNPVSDSVSYTSDNGQGIRVSWDKGFRELALWSPPGGDFLCIEPWHGTASPADFGGEITEKPGVMLIPPREIREATYRIEVLSAA
jgi:galactose mutarotase-like enzyme